MYEEFEENSPRRRPTKMMLEWLKSESPGMTVGQLRIEVKKIDRADALRILDRYLSAKGITLYIKRSNQPQLSDRVEPC